MQSGTGNCSVVFKVFSRIRAALRNTYALGTFIFIGPCYSSNSNTEGYASIS